ncbi:hypothetical protein [Thalassotalea euphylliae]|uniref:Uncharacterized protein n=1 Tax=Thalassotalea euphylliae TaxID=1655234 RepID=A0A3E0UE47_9GAMM|nr:hypothetical protein [Thalassotalea euphylliae]REL35120.1 hypothetical protein DXX92_06975 [Thalassotalea euphylliae]
MKAKLTVGALLAICPLTWASAQNTDANSTELQTTETPVEKVANEPQAVEEKMIDLAQASKEQEAPSDSSVPPTEETTEVATEVTDEFEPSVAEMPTEVFSDEEQTDLSTTLDDLSSDVQAAEANIDSSVDDTPYNFVRPTPEEGDVFIPVLSDAKVFAEFIDELPAVVNFFTMASEDEIIAFYSENYGEPVEQERKRGRLNVTFYLQDVATRVVISEQDNRRQVDVLQESAAL